MKKIVSVMSLLALAACSSSAPEVPKGVKVGKTYTVLGQTYTPEYDPHYDETGMASWYGPGFHGKPTATGEQFDKYAMTAAHRTLPMPSMVRVTNLETGKSIVVRVNDRGPFKDNRIIDLSKAAATELGVKQAGLAKVRVQYLKQETEEYWAKMNMDVKDIKFAKNDPYAPKDEDGPGKYDGMVVAQDDASAQVKPAAPITSVVSRDIDVKDMKVRPIEPKFQVVGDANADESKPVEKTVQLVGADGKPVGKQPTALKSPPVIAKTESPRDVRTATPEKAAPASGGSWFIQAGAFSSEVNATKLANQLKSIGGVDSKQIQVNGATLHRVRVGPFATKQEVEMALAKVVQKGASGAKVVKD